MLSREKRRELRGVLRTRRLDGLLVVTPVNRAYLSGFTGSRGLLLVTPRSVALFVEARHISRARRESLMSVQNMDALAPMLKQQRLLRVGVEDRIGLKDFRSLRARYRGVRWVATKDLIETIRMQKDAREIVAIRRGSRIIDAVFRRVEKLVAEKVRRGLTEFHVAQCIEAEGRRLGADGMAFPPIVASGPHAASPHHAPTLERIRRGTFLLLDFGMLVRGYHSDFTRTLFIGQPTARQRALYEIVREAHERAVGRIRTGVRAAEIDRTARHHIARCGYGGQFTHSTGHGVGREIHELPSLSPESPDILLENAVVTVEPGIYVGGRCGIRIEDMVRVGAQPRIFSSIPRDFAAMQLRL